jgi:hypothetical protein
LYRPPEAKLKNLKAKNYLGQAKLVAATEEADAFIGFTGSEKVKAADLARSKTTAGRVERPQELPTPAPSRRPTESPRPKATPPAPPPITKPIVQRSNTVAVAPSREASRYVDDLLNDYTDYPPPPVPQGQSQQRVADWAAQNTTLKAPRGYGGDELAVKRSQTTKTRRIKEEIEEEGYGSDEEQSKLVKIRIKIYYNGDVRGMVSDEAPLYFHESNSCSLKSINSSMTLFEFVDRIRTKFGLESTPNMRFKDEDGVRVFPRCTQSRCLMFAHIRSKSRSRTKMIGRLLWKRVKRKAAS